jgi:polyhydroxybutyrate depolymerase
MRVWMRVGVSCLAMICTAAHAGSISRHIDVHGQARTYSLYVPASASESAPAALVIALHGGLGQGRSMATLSGFSQLADREGFLVAYPDGLRRHWRDGRTMPDGMVDVVADDVAFISALIDDAATLHALDTRRIYATGMSNGAIFSHYLALKLSDRIAAIAPVAGGIASETAAVFHPATPVSVLMINGRDDPLVPYGGGAVAKTHGSIVPTSRALQLWLEADGLLGAPHVRNVAAQKTGDCIEQWQTWSGGRLGTAVTMVSLGGGGHTWPGGAQYLPKLIVGGVCSELDATRTIWEFFRQHPKLPQSTGQATSRRHLAQAGLRTQDSEANTRAAKDLKGKAIDVAGGNPS